VTFRLVSANFICSNSWRERGELSRDMSYRGSSRVLVLFLFKLQCAI
jgi:hypothetical protein